MWKQIHTLTIRENPNTSAMCRFTEVLNPVAHPEVVLLVEEDADQACDCMLATWVPANAKKGTWLCQQIRRWLQQSLHREILVKHSWRKRMEDAHDFHVTVHPLRPW